MVILLVLFLLTIGLALVINLYAIVNPFLDNMGDIKNYNIAYYGAIGSIERAYLVLKHHKAGFEGSGGWNGTTTIGPTSDGSLSMKLSFLTNPTNGTWYQIKSRVSGKIPTPGMGNIEKDLSSTTGDPSKNYNKLEYLMSEEFVLDIDNTTDTNRYYTGAIDITKFAGSVISGTIRLPPLIYSGFGNQYLTTSYDVDGDGITNDVIVNRTLFGKYGTGTFNILPNIDADYTSFNVNQYDSVIREDIVNASSNINFGNNKNPLLVFPGKTDLVSGHNIVPNDSPLTGLNFNNIFSDTNVKDLHLKFSLVNVMKTISDHIYPFLEYKLDFGTQVPDRFFNISGVGKVGKYEVKVLIKKPVVNTTSASDFAILF